MSDIPRYIMASAAAHFNTIAEGLDIPMFVEGQNRDTKLLKAFFELRLDGPDESRYSGESKYQFMINVLIQVSLDSGYYHRIHEIAGTIAEGFWNFFPIYTYGDDEITLLECAQLLKDYKGRDVRIMHYGQRDAHIRIQQAAVAGQYILTV